MRNGFLAAAIIAWALPLDAFADAPSPAPKAYVPEGMPPPRKGPPPRPTAPGAVPVQDLTRPPPFLPPIESPQPKVRVHYRNLFAGRFNPLGLINDFKMSARLQLYTPSSDFTAENWVGVGTSVVLTPAWVRAGPFVELQPLSILTLSGGIEGVGFVGTFNQLQSFPDANSAYDDGTLKALSNAGGPGGNYKTYGQVGWAEARFQVKLFNLAMRSSFRAYYSDVQLREGDTVYYDQIQDILLADKGWATTSETDFLWFFDDRWILGLRYTWVHTFLPDPAGGPNVMPPQGDEEFARKTEFNRIGPIFTHRFFDTPWAAFNQPTLSLLVQWSIDHPYRTGDGQCPTSATCTASNGKAIDSSRSNQGVPLIALAFSFNGDLIPPKKKK